MTTRLDISIGPVQGFVSQSRRTRDLWGSSYLLAFLSAHAMRGAELSGGSIVQPVVEGDALFRWVSGDRQGPVPRIGTVPNHFVVELCGDARPVAEAAEASLKAAWERVCRAVWARFVEHANAYGNGTEAIWQRQVRSFWDVTWTAGPHAEDGGLLARRKHWRTHCAPDEPGDKCTVMHDLQELSGHVRSGSGKEQDEFWGRIRHRVGPLDIRENERLCAIALVKRLFPRREVAVEALDWQVVASHWPSTVYIGAVPWIRDVVTTVPQQAREYAKSIRQHQPVAFSEEWPPFSGLKVEAAGDFAKLDANYLHTESVTNERLCPLADGTANGNRDGLAGRLQEIYAAQNKDEHLLGGPPRFYALLLADGDRLGKLVGGLGGPVVSSALASFTGKVPEIVKGYDGVTVYAGGDDVLAMLPVTGALRCADALSKAYGAGFPAAEGNDIATLSAAVVFAHVRLPLRSVLDEAHRLLDDVAKDGNGRNSLAAAVLKPGGRHCQWVTSWTRPAVSGSRAVTLIDNLVEELGNSTAEPGLSSGLIYRIRELLATLCGWNRWQPGDWSDVPTGLALRPFLYADVLHSLDVTMEDRAKSRADDLTERVCALLFRSRATEVGVTGVGVDALVLARFLADREQQESDR